MSDNKNYLLVVLQYRPCLLTEGYRNSSYSRCFLCRMTKELDIMHNYGLIVISLLVVNWRRQKSFSSSVQNRLQSLSTFTWPSEITSAAKLYYNNITKCMSQPYSTDASLNLVLCMVSKFIHTSMAVQKGQMNVDRLLYLV